jgi:hypothetical protein
MLTMRLRCTRRSRDATGNGKESREFRRRVNFLAIFARQGGAVERCSASRNP